MIQPPDQHGSRRVMCDCCGREELARITPDGKLAIYDKRHGQRHFTTLEGADLTSAQEYAYSKA